MDLLTPVGLFVAALIAIGVSTFRSKRFRLPPGPFTIPIFGNWLQVCGELNHRNLTNLAKGFGEIFLLRFGQSNLVVVVSSSELAKEVLHTQGVEFGSRTFDISTGKGEDEHVPLFINKVVQENMLGLEGEVARVIHDVKRNFYATSGGMELYRRIKLMMYNIVYRIMFDRRFENEMDPLFKNVKDLNKDRKRLAQYNYDDFIPMLRPFLKGD